MKIFSLSGFSMIVFFAAGLAFTGRGADSATPENVTDSIKDAISRQLVSEQEAEAKAAESVRLANQEFSKSNYEKAISYYLDAISILKNIGNEGTAFKRQIKKCQEQIYKCYFYWAQDLADKAENRTQAGKLDEAISYCKQAMEIYPPARREMEARIARYKRLRQAAIRKTEVTESSLVPNKENDNFDIQVMLKQGKLLYEAGQYSSAKSKFEKILLINPYNLEAIQALRAVNIKIYEGGVERADNALKERMSETAWKWATPIVPETVTGAGEGILSPEDQVVRPTEIQEKLKSIIIPRIDFEDITVPTAIKYLIDQSKQLDPEGDGVNIFLRLTPTAADATVKQQQQTQGNFDGGFDQPGQAEQAARPAQTAQATQPDFSSEGVPVVNITLENKSLGEAIYFLCKAAKLKYRVEKYAVVIASEDIPLDDLETKVFPLEHAALADIGGGEDPAMLKKHFEDRGIAFPQGSRIVYDPRISRLIVTNTLDNLSNVEQIIQNDLTAKDPMVQIQTKFIEISQTDLDELGFQYLVSSSNTGNGQLQFDRNDSTMRSAGNDDLFVFHRSVSGFDLQFAVKALNQADTQNLLSSPRITTINGQQATIRMVSEIYFPEDYSDSEMTTSQSSNLADTSLYTYMSPVPEFGDAKELGIMLSVTPEVDLARRTISLQMNPVVQGLVDWTEYTYTLSEPINRTEVIKREVIAQRTIDTKVTIYDGETIVLGGIIKDVNSEVHDKIPILGDLPLVGRLFQSRYAQSEKTNLLIFLQCRLVKPDGSHFFPDTEIRGLPEFNRLR